MTVVGCGWKCSQELVEKGEKGVGEWLSRLHHPPFRSNPAPRKRIDTRVMPTQPLTAETGVVPGWFENVEPHP